MKRWWRKKYIKLIVIYKKIKNPIILYISDKKNSYSYYLCCGKCGNKDKKIFKEVESIDILNVPGLTENIEKYQKNIKLL